MPPKKSAETASEQGALFEDVLKTNGAVDPDHLDVTVVGYDVPEGSDAFPEVTEAPKPEPTALEIATEAAEMAMERSGIRGGQRGKHSPFLRSGSYLGVKVGDFLPGFGPVTKRNFDSARLRAKSLEKTRRESKR